MTKICENPLCKNPFTPSLKRKKFRQEQRFCNKSCSTTARHYNVRNLKGLSQIPLLAYEKIHPRYLARREITELNAIRDEMEKQGYPLWNDFLDDAAEYRKQWNAFVRIFAEIEAKEARENAMSLLIRI